MSLKSSDWKEIKKDFGLHPALPAFFIDKAKKIWFAEARAAALLGLSAEQRDVLWEKPLDLSKTPDSWPFFDEDRPPLRMLQDILSAPKSRRMIEADVGLKNFRLHRRPFRLGKRSGLLIVVETVRSGDLLRDQRDRQILFRSLSHEIRTCVLALRGYTEMGIKKTRDDSAMNDLFSRMAKVGDRLDRVVHRLAELRAHLQVDKESM